MTEKIFWLVCCTLLFATQAMAEDGESESGAGLTFATSADNDQFYMQRAGLQLLPAYSSADSLAGMQISTSHYKQRSWSRDGQQLSLRFREIDPATANGWNIEAGYFRQADHDLLTLNTGYRTMFSPKTGMDLFLDRDWVETQAALDNGIHYTFGGIALDHMLTPSFTAVGVAGLQTFSDDNFRNHGRFKLIYQPITDLGLTLQLRYRAYTSSSAATAYFNPDRYEETMLAAGWRQRLQGWLLNLTAGVGQQKVATDPLSPTRLLECSLQSPVFHKSWSLRLHAITSRSASFGGPDYEYSYLQGEWLLRL